MWSSADLRDVLRMVRGAFQLTRVVEGGYLS